MESIEEINIPKEFYPKSDGTIAEKNILVLREDIQNCWNWCVKMKEDIEILKKEIIEKDERIKNLERCKNTIV